MGIPIDLDIACTVGKPFGTKIPSSGYCPPEMAAVMLKASDPKGKVEPKPEKLFEYKADVAYDLWSLGSILFNLLIGTPLWETFYGDGISHCDHLKLVIWRKSHLKNRLQETGVALKQEGEMGAAYDLLCKLLEPVHITQLLVVVHFARSNSSLHLTLYYCRGRIQMFERVTLLKVETGSQAAVWCVSRRSPCCSRRASSNASL